MSEDLLAEFLIEAPQLINQASDDLMALEQDPQNWNRLNGAFRAIHTLKGSVAIFGFAGMIEVLHAAEDVLGEIRDNRLVLDDAVLGLLLDAVTRTETWVGEIEAKGSPGVADPELSARLRAAMPMDGGIDDQPPPATAEPAPGCSEPLLAGLAPDAKPQTAALYRPHAGAYFAGDDPLAIARRVPRLLAVSVGLREPPGALGAYDPFACNLEIRLVSAARSDAVKEALRFVSDQACIVDLGGSPPAGDAAADAALARPPVERTLQIAASRVDRLASLMDELIVAKNALGELSLEAGRGLSLGRILDGLAARRVEFDRLVERLHGSVMDLRLVPLAPTLRRLPRLVRQAAAELGKTVVLVIEEDGARADKSVVEALFEPLLHLLRNAVDHGLETPAERRAAGKPPDGRLTLGVRSQGAALLAEIRDDGRGIDPDRLRAAALARGMVSQAELEALSDADTMALIFRPGFSTAASITNLSGRGVGLDAVRNAIASLGGTVAVASTRGVGTTVSLTLPINVALTRLLVVEVGADLYGVPMDHVIETVRVTAERVVPIRAGRALVVRDKTAPLFDLGELLGGAGPDWSAIDHKVIVVRGVSGPLAIRVDDLLQPIDTAMRPLSGLLAGMPGVLGAALLGDGRVMMAVDLPRLIG
jgi:two-component system, chemotaxis family, sensor kinase CheA